MNRIEALFLASIFCSSAQSAPVIDQSDATMPPDIALRIADALDQPLNTVRLQGLRYAERRTGTVCGFVSVMGVAPNGFAPFSYDLTTGQLYHPRPGTDWSYFSDYHFTSVLGCPARLPTSET